jgi:hypothetical protein
LEADHQLGVHSMKLLVALLLFLPLSAKAAPPPGADPNSPIAKWFEQLKQPGTQIGCCSIADCRPVDADQDLDGTFVAIIDKHVVKIPQDKVIWAPNPIGKPVACYSIEWNLLNEEHFHILCFVPGYMI